MAGTTATMARPLWEQKPLSFYANPKSQEETQGQILGQKNNGFFSAEFCGHYKTRHFPMQTTLILNMLIPDLPFAFPKQ